MLSKPTFQGRDFYYYVSNKKDADNDRYLLFHHAYWAKYHYRDLTAECVEIYLKKSPSSVLRLVGDINHEIGLLIQLKELFLQAGGIQEEEDA
ncbi:hypothetical protein FACS1894211_05110 [Clostridia bacterium]|nr:hypothetical protein FACS1894211_05110 [Clostridia bacterium]